MTALNGNGGGRILRMVVTVVGIGAVSAATSSAVTVFVVGNDAGVATQASVNSSAVADLRGEINDIKRWREETTSNRFTRQDGMALSNRIQTLAESLADLRARVTTIEETRRN